jgi:hypothetical protein
MDMETDRAPQNMVESGQDAPSNDQDSDSTSGALLFANHHRMIWMPSSRAIADAIIRRTVAEMRG